MFFVPSAGGVPSGRLQAAQFEHKESFSQFVSDPANPVANSLRFLRSPRLCKAVGASR